MRNVLVMLAMFIVSNTFGQDDLEIITFENDNSSTSTLGRPYAVVKTNPVSFVFGQQFVEYEHLFYDFLSVEAGVGLTFRPTLQAFEATYVTILNELIASDCSSVNYAPEFDYCDERDYGNFDIRTVGIGPWISGGVKFYIYNDALDGPYIALNLKYHRNNYRVLEVEETLNFERTTDSYVNENQANFDYTVRIGSQYLYGPLTTEGFVGFGIRNIRQNRLDVGFDAGKDTWTNSFQTTTNSIFHFEMGVRMGVELKRQTSSKSKKKKKKRRRR